MLLQRIKYFATVVECNSFTEAAELCYISQSAISQQINALEAELGVKLYERSGRKFELTLAGEYFYRHGKDVLREVENLKKETARIGCGDKPELTIGYLSGYDGDELSTAIAEFSAIYPEVNITVFGGTHEDLYDALKNDRASLVVSDQRRAFSDEYENFVLKQSPAYIAFSGQHPLAGLKIITTTDLEKYPCIVVAGKDRAEAERDFYGNTLGIGKTFVFADTPGDAKLTALGGRGYMLIDKIGIKDAETLSEREVKRPDGSTIVRTYCAFWKKRKSNYYIEEFADTLRKNFL